MVTCRSCEGTRLARILDLGEQPWGNDFIPIEENRKPQKYPLELFFCRSCALIQIGHTIPKERMFTEHLYFSGTTDRFEHTSSEWPLESWPARTLPGAWCSTLEEMTARFSRRS